MRWSIIRTIWFREMRDQLRDRRTLFMILGLPLLLYPVLGTLVLHFAQSFAEKPSIIGIVTESPLQKNFPPRVPPFAGRSTTAATAWLSATPLPGSDLAQWIGAFSLAHMDQQYLEYPLFLQGGELEFLKQKGLELPSNLKFRFYPTADRAPLEESEVDILVRAPAHFYQELEKGEAFSANVRPLLEFDGRWSDQRSRLAMRRLQPVLTAWKQELKKTRLARTGVTETFLDPFELRLPKETESSTAPTQRLLDMVVRIFPFMLVMWSLAGALYPAVDLCAGEKERGTMETLLITPAGREEIVLGKFLTIWVFSSATALLNLVSMGITTTQFSTYLPQGGISIPALLWCVVLSLPQSAFFSAISLAIGAYARSSKEGQYYLMPLFLITMPLIFLTLAPGVELNAFYSMVPVTGVALLMQRLMTAGSLGEIPWVYFIPVLAPMALYSWLALRWAIEQFNREGVLFREAERLDVMLWLKRLFREKEPVPTVGEAFFCLGMLLGLRWFSLGLGTKWPLEIHTAISQLAFVAMPALFMVLLLNTQPSEALSLRWPRGRETALAVLLALLLLPPLVGLTQGVVLWFPHLLEGMHPIVGILAALHTPPVEEFTGVKFSSYLLAYALVPAICEEIAFRGLVLRGLQGYFRPRDAVFLSSFFFALFHMNVFLFLPMFVLGVVLGLLTVRSRSLLPAILFHFLHNSVLILLIPLRQLSLESLAWFVQPLWSSVIAGCLIVAGGLFWWLYRKPYIDLARREQELAEKAANR
jgi:sodium transport system permease protein